MTTTNNNQQPINLAQKRVQFKATPSIRTSPEGKEEEYVSDTDDEEEEEEITPPVQKKAKTTTEEDEGKTYGDWKEVDWNKAEMTMEWESAIAFLPGPVPVRPRADAFVVRRIRNRTAATMFLTIFVESQKSQIRVDIPRGEKVMIYMNMEKK